MLLIAGAVSVSPYYCTPAQNQVLVFPRAPCRVFVWVSVRHCDQSSRYQVATSLTSSTRLAVRLFTCMQVVRPQWTGSWHQQRDVDRVSSYRTVIHLPQWIPPSGHLISAPSLSDGYTWRLLSIFSMFSKCPRESCWIPHLQFNKKVKIWRAAAGKYRHGDKVLKLLQICGQILSSVSQIRLLNNCQCDEFEPLESGRKYAQSTHHTQHKLTGVVFCDTCPRKERVKR